jgi:putative ABC transport system permease protein
MGYLNATKMLFNYFKIAFRNLAKNRLFSIINISGMAISLASCFLIALFVWDEWRFDNFHPDGDRTFRVYNIRNGDDGATNFLPIVPLTFGPYMQKDFPEVESTLRLLDTYGEQLFDVGGKRVLYKDGIYAEPSVFEMLSIYVVEGDARTALTQPNKVALSQGLSKKLFGDGHALGQVIKIGSEDYEVTAIYKDTGRHFHLKPSYLISFSTISKNWTPQRFENWVWQQFFTYLKLKPGTDAKAFEAKLLPFVEKYAYPKIKPEGFTYVPHLQNIRDIHLHSSNFEWEIALRGNAQTVYILSLTGVFLLVIACLNFINLSTARAIRRMKEVGVRKVVGALRSQLIWQFISESVVITLIGLGAAIVMAELTLPYLNAFAEKDLILPYSPLFTGAVVLFCIIIGIIAGSYPAFHLSRFRPAMVLYNKNTSSGNTALFRQGLVVLQFMFSFFLIMGSIVVLTQNDLLRNMDMGFKKDQLVMIPLRSKQLKQYETTKREFSNHPNIISATVGYGIPGDIIAGDGVIDPTIHKNLPTNMFCIDQDFITTMGMKVIAGRDFSKEFSTDSTEGFIINETAVRTFGFESPEKAIGHPLDWQMWGKDSIKHGRVIGVVKDFHFKSLREQLTPVVMHIYPQAFWKLTLRIEPREVTSTLAFLKSTYERLDPEWPFTYKFVDENYDSMYKAEQKLSRLFTIFTGLAIGVACLGLFGLVEYSVNQRAKEISIRKVFGASANSLLLLLTKKYFILVVVAFIIVIPLSYYTAQQWLSNFAFHIQISPFMYLEACGLVLLITSFTVSFQSLRAAWANPAHTLRNE